MYNIVIGYDRDNRMPAYTLIESIYQNASSPVNITLLHKNALKEFTRPRGIFDSTEFSISRFLTPYLSNYEGWSLFLDNDMIVCGDIIELFNMKEDKYKVLCVKHNQIVKSNKKFLGKEQSQYKYKNWSSVMMFNNSKCKNLTVDYVNTAPGLDLHQFKWVGGDEYIGDLPLEWNYLVDNENQTKKPPKLIHYTDGGPYFKETKDCSYNDCWLKIYNEINDVRSLK